MYIVEADVDEGNHAAPEVACIPIITILCGILSGASTVVRK